MSGVIVPNGFRFLNAQLKKPKLEDVYQFVDDLRQRAGPLLLTMASDYIAQEATVLYDNQVLRPMEDPPNPLAYAANMLKDRQQSVVRNPGERAPDVDFSVSFQIYPTKKYVLGMFFTQQSSFIRMIRECTWFEEYAYWGDAAAPLPGVGGQAWIERGVEWEDVLIKPQRLLNGLTVHVSLVDQYVPLSLESVRAQIPSTEQRVKRALKAALFEEYGELQGTDFEVNRSNMVEQIRLFQQWRESEAGQAREALAEPEIRQKLPVYLTTDMLARGAPKLNERLIVPIH
jgi:hypothetical protein